METRKGVAKLDKTEDGEDMHYSVGALIERNNKYLLIDRVNEPLGFAGLAGHIDEGETPGEALFREVEEESKLKIEKYELIAEELIDQEGLGFGKCSKGVSFHRWYLYRCEVSREPVLNPHEAKSTGWYSVDQIKEFESKKKLEPVWEYWFKKLEII